MVYCNNIYFLQGIVLLVIVATVTSSPVEYSGYAASSLLHTPIAAKYIAPEPVVSTFISVSAERL